MFHDFDQRFFNGTLVNNGVEVDWSPKMTQCAGLCRFQPGTSMCSIKLSKPLLQLRTRKDLVETLVHEMIHALLFVLRESDNRESHGPKFHEIMFRINKEAQLNITVYHDFHDEVNHYRNHVWRCAGVCRNRAPYYGWVKRSMNRKPGPYDTWWSQHQQTCGGAFEKVREPEGFQDKKSKKNENDGKSKDIRQFFTPTKSGMPSSNPTPPKPPSSKPTANVVGFDDLMKKDVKDEFDDFGIPKSITPFKGVGVVLGASNINNPQPGRSILLTKFGNNKSTMNGDQNNPNNLNQNRKVVSSTVTSSMFTKATIGSTKSPTASSSNIPLTNSSRNGSTTTNQNKSSAELIVLDDSSRNDSIRNKSPVNHFDRDSMDRPTNDNKRQKVNETITLSDDEDYSWLKDISDEQLIAISQPDPILID